MLEVNGLDKVEIDVIKDYEVSPATRRARIIMQTCAHISGAAHYYDSKNSSFPENEKVSLLHFIFGIQKSNNPLRVGMSNLNQYLYVFKAFKDGPL